MTTVADAFDKFLKKIELTETDRAAVIAQHEDIRKKLREHVTGVADDFLTGSYKRGTAIRPPHDVDVFLVLKEDVHGKQRSAPVKECLEMVHGALAKAYPDKASIRVQQRSVNIAVGGVGYDIVPAFVHDKGGYLIADRERTTWIRSDPKVHAEKCNAANQRAGGMLNALIKAAKRWKDVHGKPLGSFHLEVMAYEAFSQAPKSYPEGLGALFTFLGTRVKGSCDEPAKLGAKVDQGMTREQRDAIGARFETAAARAREAIAHDAARRPEQAHTLWRSLLGEDYPEKGS
jgi:hypothetical protein